jgi:hypothetical protein
MKLLIIYQFYLDYFLPRNNEWEDKQFGFEFKDDFISVRPKNANEDLFPNNIDKKLSTMSFSLRKLDFSTSALKRKVEDVVVDRTEVRVETICNNIGELQNDGFRQEKFARAVRCCNIFLKHCRVLAENPFLKLLPREYSIKQKRYYNLFPHTITYLNKDNPDEQLEVFNGANAAASSGAIPSPESGTVDIHKILKTPEPDFYNSMVVDASEMISTERLREGILLLAICCETKINKAFNDKGISETQLKKYRKDKVSFAQNYFDVLPSKFIARSLKDEDNQTFALLEQLYRVRNKIAHEGRCVLELDDGGEREVDESLSIDFLNTTKRVLIWINNAFT